MFAFAQQVQAVRRQQQGQMALRQIFSNPDSIDPTTGLPKPEAVRTVMQVDPELGMKLQDQTLETQARLMQAHHSQTEAGAQVFDFSSKVAGIGYNAYLDAQKAGKPEQAAIAAGQTARNEAAQNNGGILSDQAEAGILGTPFDPQKALALARTNKEFVTASHDEANEDIATKREANTEEHDRALEGLANRRINITVNNQGGSPASAAPGSPEDQALDYAAQQYRLTGKMPPMGQGKAGASFRMAILERAAGQAKAGGGSAASDLATASDVHATQTGLGQLARTAANVESFEGTATKEADLALSLLDKGSAKTGVPVLNAWVQSGRKAIGGDKDVSAFDAAITSFKNEYARIMSSPGGTGGVTSDSARHEADALINDAQTPEQVRSVIDTMKKGMNNRIKSIKEEHDALVDKLKTSGKPAPSSANPETPGTFNVGQVYRDGKGNKARYNADGTFTDVP